MKMLYQLALRNVKVHWKQSLAALLTITAAFISLVLFSGYMKHVANNFEEGYSKRAMYGDLIIENKDLFGNQAIDKSYGRMLTKPQQEEIRKFLESHPLEVSHSARFLSLQGLASTGNTSTIFWGLAYDPVDGAKMRGELWEWNTKAGLPLDKSPVKLGALLGYKLSQNLGCTADESQFANLNNVEGYPHKDRSFSCLRPQVQLSLLNEEGQLNALDLDIVGFVDGGFSDLDKRYLQMSLETAQDLLATDKISYWTVAVKSENLQDALIADFNATVGKKFPVLRMSAWKTHKIGDLYVKTMDLLGVFRTFVFAIIFSISVLSVFNMMIKVVKERTKEIGTLRSLGFHPSQILSIFGLESFFLVSIGSSVGALASLAITIFIRLLRVQYKAGLMSEPTLFRITFDGFSYLSCFAFLAFISVMVTLLMVWKPLRAPIAQNLSYA